DGSWYYRPLYNIAHVDVLEGPAAILYGRGGPAGLINLVTKKPRRKRLRHLQLRLGSWQQRHLTLDVGGARGARGAWRLMAMGERSEGFRDHYFVHRWAVNPEY